MLLMLTKGGDKSKNYDVSFYHLVTADHLMSADNINGKQYSLQFWKNCLTVMLFMKKYFEKHNFETKTKTKQKNKQRAKKSA